MKQLTAKASHELLTYFKNEEEINRERGKINQQERQQLAYLS